jgi:hypothetical protein
MSLKQVLDRLWNDNVVRCPRHRVWWNSDYQGTAVPDVDEPLFYAKGKRIDIKPPKVKSDTA